MGNTSKSKILVIAVMILLLTNIGMLLFILCNKPQGKNSFRKDREAMMRSFLQKDIGFDQKQMDLYDTLNKAQKEIMRIQFDEVRSNKQEIYKAVGDQAFTDTSINDAATKLSVAQRELEYNLLIHFASIRRLCTPGQQEKFDSLFYKLWNKRDDKKENLNNNDLYTLQFKQ